MRQLMRQLKGRRLPITAKLTATIALSAVISVTTVTLFSLHRQRQVYREELEGPSGPHVGSRVTFSCCSPSQ